MFVLFVLNSVIMNGFCCNISKEVIGYMMKIVKIGRNYSFHVITSSGTNHSIVQADIRLLFDIF